VDIREVDDAIGCGRSAAQAIKIIERTAVHLCACRGYFSSARIGTSQAEDLVPCLDQLADDGGADESCRASNENFHEKFLQYM
jgi:hypothetical protein